MKKTIKNTDITSFMKILDKLGVETFEDFKSLKDCVVPKGANVVECITAYYYDLKDITGQESFSNEIK